MSRPVLTHEGELVRGTVVDRPNRFVLTVRFDSSPERVFLGDPGALAVLDEGSTVLCEPVDDPDRKTGYDAVAVEVEDVYVSLKAALANDLFQELVETDRLPAFERYRVTKREPQLPDHGRADFLLDDTESASGDVYVEVKSCTHVEAGVAKFPDRQTERGRRHLRSLESLATDGTECHLVFVVQRPDATRLRPFRAVDPEFADLLESALDAGVRAHAIAIEFDPPHYYLDSTDPPIELVE